MDETTNKEQHNEQDSIQASPIETATDKYAVIYAYKMHRWEPLLAFLQKLRDQGSQSLLSFGNSESQEPVNPNTYPPGVLLFVEACYKVPTMIPYNWVDWMKSDPNIHQKILEQPAALEEYCMYLTALIRMERTIGGLVRSYISDGYIMNILIRMKAIIYCIYGHTRTIEREDYTIIQVEKIRWKHPYNAIGTWIDYHKCNASDESTSIKALLSDKQYFDYCSLCVSLESVGYLCTIDDKRVCHRCMVHKMGVVF